VRNRSIFVLTGGPGGGKSTLLEELQRDPTWTGRFVAMPETILIMEHFRKFLTVEPGPEPGQPTTDPLPPG